jgi:ubiquinone/menaquinone biosynthesis C-methylase UbiE
MKKSLQGNPILEQNYQLYTDYYAKPSWWFKNRYDTQVKKKTVIYLIRQAELPKTGQKILEIGFGSGEVLFSFGKTSELYGIELSQSAVDLANQRASSTNVPSYEFKISLGDKIDFPENMFDLVIASHVIEHVESDQVMLQEVIRVLKPHGKAVFLIPINENYPDPQHMRKYTETSFTEFLRTNGVPPILCSIKNELLFHIVEKFYFEHYNKRWKIRGPIISAIFNFSTAWIPFWGMRAVDKVFLKLGYKPRQFGCVVEKPGLP